MSKHRGFTLIELLVVIAVPATFDYRNHDDETTYVPSNHRGVRIERCHAVASVVGPGAAAQKALSRGVPEFPTYHRLEGPVVQRLEYLKYFGYLRGYVNGALMDLALAYLMTQEARYADAAKTILLDLASWPTADDDVTSVSAKWGDEAGLSLAQCAHRAYDWLYDALDERERALVFKMCRERAWPTYRRLGRRDYLTYPGASHNGRLIAYLADMSLALAGENGSIQMRLPCRHGQTILTGCRLQG